MTNEKKCTKNATGVVPFTVTIFTVPPNLPNPDLYKYIK